MVLVAGEYRRRGIGTMLMRRPMEDLAADRLVPVLDATPDGHAVYQALGFEDSWGFHRLVRRVRRSAADAPPTPPHVPVRPITYTDRPAPVAFPVINFRAGR